MKKHSILLPFISLFLIFVSAAAQGQSYRFVIKVISADRKEPIEGARIKIEAKSVSHSETRFENADWEGMAYREFDFHGTFTINAEASGYYGTIQVVTRNRKDPSGDVPVTLILKRRSGVKIVVVNVFEKGSGQLIYDAKVNLKGNNYNSYNGSTNNMGEVVIPVDRPDDYEVTVSHTGYETRSAYLRVRQNDDEENQYQVNFELTPTKNFKRVMFVKVQTRQMDGSIWDVPHASVTFRYEGSVFEHKADEQGITEFNHNFAPGEQVVIDVSMGGYKSQSKSITIKASGLPAKGILGSGVGGERDVAFFTLVKEKGLERTLHVKVVDDKGDVVKFADVNFPDDGLKITNAYGECEYTITWPTDVPLNVSAEKKGYTKGSAVASLRSDDVEIRLIKKAAERTLRIDVRDQKGNPIPYADISFPDGNSKNTDMSGHAEYDLAAPTDETVKLEVAKKGYKTKSVEAGPGKVQVVVVLDKEAGAKRTLHIAVKDNKGQAIKFADLNFPDGQLKLTDAYGNCEYVIEWPGDEAVKIEIEKSGYHPKSVNAAPGNNYVSVILEKDANTEACDAADEAAFAKLMGTWKSYRMHITISGSCNKVSGTWKVTEWCEGVDATYNTSVARVNGTFEGRMKNGSLQVSFKSPPSPNNKEGTKGNGSIYLQNNGILSCSFGCKDGDLERSK